MRRHKYVQLYRDWQSKEMADCRVRGLSWGQIGMKFEIDRSAARQRVNRFLRRFKDIYTKKIR